MASDLSEELTKCAMWGSLELLDSLLGAGADPNYPNKKGDSPLHEAAYHGEIECASSLLRFRADVNRLGHGGKTPLHKAVSGVLSQVPKTQDSQAEAKIHDKQMDIVRLLVAHGADLKITDVTGFTPRELAMQCDFYKCADLIDELEQMQQKAAEDRIRQSRITGLFSACEKGEINIVKDLLTRIPEALNDFIHNDENLLMCAARAGQLEMVEYLLNNGAVAVASRVSNKTALHNACEEGHTEVVVCLLNRLPALLEIDDSPGETSLHIAARHGHTNIVRNLVAVATRAQQIRSRENSVENDAFLYREDMSRVPMNDSLPEMTLDVMAESFNEAKTPLHEAAANGHVEIVEILIDYLSQYPRSDSSRSGTPSHSSTSPPTTTKVITTPVGKKTISIVPGIDLMTLKGRTAFHEASKSGHFEVMKVLLEAGADINAFMRLSIDTSINTDLTALVQACLMEEMDIVHFLLQNGATDARLKALKRTLGIPNDKIAGLLLCYNGGVKEMSISTRSRKPGQSPPKQDSVVPVEAIWKSKNLKYISSSWLNVVMELPRFKNRSPSLVQVDVSSNMLTELPIELFQLPSLKQLDANRNQIGTLPLDEKGTRNRGWKCPQLTQLDIMSNRLTSLPNCLFSLPELKELNVSDNQITYVPPSIWTAPKLSRIVLSKNQLTQFPSIRHLSSLSSSGEMSPLPDDTSDLDRQFPLSVSTSESQLSDDVRDVFLPYSTPGTKNKTFSEQRETIQTQVVLSRRLESFQDMNIEVEEIDELDPLDDGEEGVGFSLIALDLSSNKLTSVPPGLCCLAPKLTKLNVSKNQLKDLGSINDFPLEIEFIDASSNELLTSIAPALSQSDYRSYVPCARKQLTSPQHGELTQSTSFSYKPCSHRAHKNLRKLSTFKLNHNQLYDLQLFKMIGRKSKGSELVASFEESVTTDQKSRSNTLSSKGKSPSGESFSPPNESMTRSLHQPGVPLRSNTMGNKKDLKQRISMNSSVSMDLETKQSNSSGHSSDSKDGSGSGNGTGQSVVIAPLFPILSTLEVAHNRLRYVPSYIHHISTLSCLVLSHNADIDTLPLELCHCEHLWNLEYEGCPLTNPPAVDLNKFKLATDKLLYMKSLLHNAKPNESMKLMLVGLQKMGKTTLLSRLRDVNEEATPYTTFTQRIKGEEPPPVTTKKQSGKRKEPLSTVGVDLGIWKYRKDLETEYNKTKKKGSKQLSSVTFYTWDFGGQEEYYVTHQCFLSIRSLYLVVWDITLKEKGIEELAPWLHNIQARAPDSPVVIVGTHCDKLRSDERDQTKAKMNDIIYQKFLIGRGPQQLREMGLPKILDVLYVSCPSIGRVEGVLELRMALYDIAFSLTLPGKGQAAKRKLLEQPIPANYLQLEERVRVLSVECKKTSTPPVLKETLFRDQTKDTIANPRELNQAVTFLHENGVMLHYDTPALSHLYFLDPQWLCDMLAHVVTIPEVNRFIQRQDGPDAGILRTSNLSHIFRGNVFPEEYRKEYVELLGKFEVALYLDQLRLLVPSMLPAKPRYTLHTFRNVFPRPSLLKILSMPPETSRLFSASPEAGNDLERSQEEKAESQLAVATHISEELFRTGLILRRFYFMTYVPSGFWPRLISRFLASEDFGEILLRSLGFDKNQIKAEMEELVSGTRSGAVSLEWSYWKTGIELWYKGLSLLRLSELTPGGSFKGCKPSPSIFEQSHTTPIEPATDAADLSFDLNGHWMPVDMTPSRGIEIIVPDTVCLAMLNKELENIRSIQRSASPDQLEESCDPGPTYPRYENHWMSAELLALAADYIDTLLEDWYPGLGAREGNKTIESIPYVNRVIPCPFCVSNANPLSKEDEVSELCLSPLVGQPKSDIFGTKGSATPSPTTKHATRHFSRSHSNSSDVQSPSNHTSNHTPDKARVKPKRALFTGNRKNSGSSTTEGESDGIPPTDMKSPGTKASKRKGSLADLGRVQNKRSGSESELLAIPIPEESPTKRPLVGSERGLEVASKFGFMFESCILTSRQDGELICPAHPENPLFIQDLAPDLVFADLPRQFILDPDCVEKGVYIDHGSFGDIYHGAVYPSPTATDDEGREVAIKIDRMDSKKYNAESATKAYVEVRTEVSSLHRLHHPNVIDFIGVVLKPLCFILEWAPSGSLSSLFKKYRKVDARISPVALQSTALQVASGLAYLHEHKIVYYDLKSPNILVFEFPSPQESLQATQPTGYYQREPYHPTELLVKIADLGISRQLSPGGVKGFKGSPGFMAPEILKYVGLEACTEKVDIFSYGMFLFELIALHFPFEKQNLMGTQIEKLVIEGERPPLQNRELNSPILYLDVMRWCWQQDYRDRPSAKELSEILTNPSIPRLVDAVSLHLSNIVTCSCVCTLPIEILPPGEVGGDSDRKGGGYIPHPHVARGDLEEELWLCTYNEISGSEVKVIDFRGKASQSFPVGPAKITCICTVSYSMWLGTEDGRVLILDATSKHTLLERLLVPTRQPISSIYCLLSSRKVLVARSDGIVLLFNEDIQEHKVPDISNFDLRDNETLLPVRSLFKSPEKLPILSTTLVSIGNNERSLWCGTKREIVFIFDITSTQISSCEKKYHKSRYEVSESEEVCSLVSTEGAKDHYVWTLTTPTYMLHCWSAYNRTRIKTVLLSPFTEHEVTSLHSMGSELHLALSNGHILLASTVDTDITETRELKGHVDKIYQLLSIGGRVLPRHWLPSIIGRSNAIDYYRDLLDEKDIKSITSTMVGYQTRLLVSIGHGYLGLTGTLVEPIMSDRDKKETFVLLWATDR